MLFAIPISNDNGSCRTDPRFGRLVTVYVMISFISTICLSASLFGLGVGVITDTSTVGEDL